MKRPLLAPLVPMYAAALRLREFALRTGLEPRQRLRWPVISVGSLSAGGAGKTPAILALAELLSGSGISVDVLSRGYGRRSAESQRVDAHGDADRFGDEPLLIARQAGVPVFLAKRRWHAGLLAEEDNANIPTIHLLDVGMQHRQLMRALEIVLLSSEDLRDHLIPAGNLREGRRALRRADVLAVSADDRDALQEIAKTYPAKEVWTYSRVMHWPQEMPQRVLAFCGIARPTQFFAGLRKDGVEVVAERAFRDHHRFTEQDIVRLSELFRSSNAEAFVTTAKDSTRLGKNAQRLAELAPVFSANLTFRLHNPEAILERVRRLLPSRMQDGDRPPIQ